MTADQIEKMSALLEDARLIKNTIIQMEKHRKIRISSEYMSERSFESDLCRKELLRWMEYMKEMIEEKITLCEFKEGGRDMFGEDTECRS